MRISLKKFEYEFILTLHTQWNKKYGSERVGEMRELVTFVTFVQSGGAHLTKFFTLAVRWFGFQCASFVSDINKSLAFFQCLCFRRRGTPLCWFGRATWRDIFFQFPFCIEWVRDCMRGTLTSYNLKGIIQVLQVNNEKRPN